MAAAANDKAIVEHKSRTMENCCPANENMLAREVKSALDNWYERFFDYAGGGAERNSEHLISQSAKLHPIIPLNLFGAQDLIPATQGRSWRNVRRPHSKVFGQQCTHQGVARGCWSPALVLPVLPLTQTLVGYRNVEEEV